MNNFELIEAIALIFENISIKKIVKGLKKAKHKEYVETIKNIENISMKSRIDLISKTKNGILIFYFTKKFLDQLSSDELNELALVQNDTHNSTYIYYFISYMGKYLSSSSIDKMVDTLISINDLQLIFNLLDEEDLINTGKISANSINKLAIAFVNSKELKNPKYREYIRAYFDRVKGYKNISIESVIDAIKESGNSMLIYRCATSLENVNIQELEDALCKIKLEDNNAYIIKFAEDIEGANIEKLANAVCKSNEAVYLYSFLRIFDDANINLNVIKKLVDAICNKNTVSGDPWPNLSYYVFSFAEYIEKLDINNNEIISMIGKLENRICESDDFLNLYRECEPIIDGSNDYCLSLYYFAINIKNANINRMIENIRKNKNSKKVLKDFVQSINELICTATCLKCSEYNALNGTNSNIDCEKCKLKEKKLKI